MLIDESGRRGDEETGGREKSALAPRMLRGVLRFELAPDHRVSWSRLTTVKVEAKMTLRYMYINMKGTEESSSRCWSWLVAASEGEVV